jgi:hypothetical protein
MKRSLLFLIPVLLVSILLVRGRSPDGDDERDPFPDYNKLDMQHAAPAPAEPPKDAPESKGPVLPTPGQAAPALPPTPGEDLNHPKPPPPARPNTDQSEPDLPGA